MSAEFGGTHTFGRLLRAHRHRAGLSLTQLAALLHYDRGHISKIETGKRPPSPTFAQACDRVFNTNTTFAKIAATLPPTPAPPAQAPPTSRQQGATS